MRPYQEGENFSTLIQAAIPGFVEAEYPLFVQFITTFLHYLERRRTMDNTVVHPEYGAASNTTIQATVALGGSVYEARKFLEYRDISSTLDEFAPHFLSMYAKNFPQRTYVSYERLITSLRQFFQEKGTVGTVSWLFRVLFNTPAEVYFPRDDILRASDGTWNAPITIKVSAPTSGHLNADVARYYIGQRIVTATGSAQVEHVMTTVYGQAYNQYVVVNELTLKFGTVLGTFAYGKDVYNIDSPEVVHTTILPVISSVIVHSGGANYRINDIVTFSEGPGQGEGYGASGLVVGLSGRSVSGTIIVNGGDGYVTGTPVMFISSTGSGAEAVVDEIIYGNILLEDGTATAAGDLLITENSLINEDYYALEDRNTIILDLTIEQFVNRGNPIVLNSPDYSAVGIVQLNTANQDTMIETIFAAVREIPFMHPWVFTSANTVALSELQLTLQMTTNTFFANGALLFVINEARDITTNAATATMSGTVLVGELLLGSGRAMVHMQNVVNSQLFTVNQTVKSSGNGTLQIGTITCDTLNVNVIGIGTQFTRVVVANSHIRFPDGNQYVVKTVVNNTFLSTWTVPSANVNNGVYSTIPVGTVRVVIPREQRYYGKIRHIFTSSPGTGYETIPRAFVDSVSARAQAIIYYDPYYFNP